MAKNQNNETAKRNLLISAIISGDKEQLEAIAGKDKKVIVLNNFLDLLKWSSCDAFSDPDFTFISTENYNQMWEAINGNKSTSGEA